MKQHVRFCSFLVLTMLLSIPVSLRCEQDLSQSESIVLNHTVELPKKDSAVDAHDLEPVMSKEAQEYDDLCNITPSPEPSRFQVWLAAIGSAIIDRYYTAKEFTIERYELLKKWFQIKIIERIRTRRAANNETA